ncbi:hypothetical protein [Roseovarius nanhaiticus]|uniref:hypothetical protein n=1 Tax=Roseovarius nanhaiticus TaxID=573024 RepID=UPI00248F9181|nr:hypothetical protein [Roseovarius nanhaiticus]
MSNTHPVVLRFKSMFPGSMTKMLMHAKRQGGPLDHVEISFSHRNRVLLGENFVADVSAEILEMKKHNRDAEVSALRAQNRNGKANERNDLGLIDPWKSSENGPLREFVLTADTDYFRAAPDAPEDKIMTTYGITEHGETVQHRLCTDKINAFEKRGREFFERFFPDAVRHLRLDLDEETPHFHGLLLQRTTKTSGRRGEQHLIQPTSHPLLKNYEHAQDEAGLFFSTVGLRRGEQHAKKRRTAKAANETMPKAPANTSPREYRRSWQKSMDDRQQTIAAKEAATELQHILAAKDRTRAQREASKASEKNRDADERISEVGTKVASAEAFITALTVGVDAIETRQIDYQKKTDKKNEGLKFGPEAPKKKSDRKKLGDIIRPAYEKLLKFARGVFQSRQREENLEMAAAENARQAAILAQVREDAGQERLVILDQIASGTSNREYKEASFPGAWAISRGEDLMSVQTRTDALTNVALRKCYKATSDAVRLCDDGSLLQKNFHRGAKVLAFGAAQRGLNLESGKHDPDQATDPGRARLHVDVDPQPMRIRVLNRQRERGRG